MKTWTALKVGVVAGFSAAFAAVSSVRGQNVPPMEGFEQTPEPSLSREEQESRISHKGPDPHRPYKAFYVAAEGYGRPLITENENAIVHIASTTKLITAFSFYRCKEIALEEAVDSTTRDSIEQRFNEIEENYLKPALVYSNNHHANKVGMFLENLELDFINQGIEEQGLERGGYQVFSKVIVPRVLEEAGIENTVVFNPTGLPPYDYGKGGIYPEEEWPYNYKGTKEQFYKDPDEYNRSTPRDMVDLTIEIVKTYPEIHEITAMPRIIDSLKAGPYYDLANTNHLLENSIAKNKWPVEGVDFGKTGTSNGGGALTAVSAGREMNGVEGRVYAFVAGAKKPERDKCDERTAHLIEQAFKELDLRGHFMLKAAPKQITHVGNNIKSTELLVDDGWLKARQEELFSRQEEVRLKHNSKPFGFINKKLFDFGRRL